MLVHVRVSPNAKEARVTEAGHASFEVRVDEKATGGRANKRLVEILAEHFGVPKAKVRIVKGARSREKVVEVGL